MILLCQMCGHKELKCCHLLLKQYPKIPSLFQIGICLASVDWLKPVFSYSLLSWDKTFKNIFSLYILIFFHWHSYGTCLLKCKVNDSRRGLCLVIFKEYQSLMMANCLQSHVVLLVASAAGYQPAICIFQHGS